MPKLRNGHAPGHVRETFINAIDAFMTWEDGEPEPTVEYEVNCVPRQITLSQAYGLLWNCNDILPGFWFQDVREPLGVERQTYAAVAQAMHKYIAGGSCGGGAYAAYGKPKLPTLRTCG